MDVIVNQLIAKRNKLGLSVPKLAEALEIPMDRIYKWEQDKGNPKGQDIEKVKKWLEEVPNSSEVTEPKPDYDSRRSLERTLENLSEDKIRSTAIIERLVALLEKSFNSGVPGKVPSAPSVRDIPGEIPVEPEDLVLGKKYQKGKAGQRDK